MSIAKGQTPPLDAEQPRPSALQAQSHSTSKFSKALLPAKTSSPSADGSHHHSSSARHHSSSPRPTPHHHHIGATSPLPSHSVHSSPSTKAQPHHHHVSQEPPTTKPRTPSARRFAPSSRGLSSTPSKMATGHYHHVPILSPLHQMFGGGSIMVH